MRHPPRGREGLVRKQLGLLALAERLQNVSLACKISSVSRTHFYRIKKAYDSLDGDGVLPQGATRWPRSYQVPREMEYLILMITARHPTIAYRGLVTRLKLDGINVSGEMVKSIWRRFNLTTRAARVAWMGQPEPWKLIEMGGHSRATSQDGVSSRVQSSPQDS